MNTRILLMSAVTIVTALILVLLLRDSDEDREGATPLPANESADGASAGGGLASTGSASDDALTAPSTSGPTESGDAGRRPADAESADDATARALLEARRWLEARRKARAAEDEAAEAAAREAWDRSRKALIARLQRDTPASLRFLDLLGADDDKPTALYLGTRVLPFLWGKGFDGHLMQRVRSAGGSTHEKRLAMAGLKGRGEQAARVIGNVAAEAADPVLRTAATRELASHLTDPKVLPARHEIHAHVVANLQHTDADVRLAALVTLAAERRPLSASTRIQVEKLRDDDPDRRVRSVAARLLSTLDR